MRGDDFYLRQALQNIIDNGLRHCGENGVLEVACTATDGTVRVRIADNGDGIHVIHTGGEHQSYLQIPVVPPKYQVGDYIWHGDENK